MKKLLLLLPLVATTVSGAVIVPVTANASSEKSDSLATFLIDGSGLFTSTTELTPDNSLTGIHYDNSNATSSTADRSWVWSGIISEEWVEFDLGGSFNVTDAYIWQTTFSTTTRQTRTFDIEYSTDGTNYFVASADQQLGQVTPTLTVGSTAETFNFSSVTASWMRIGIDGTYENPGGGRNWLGGLGEVRFEGTAVPEPSTTALLGLGGLALILRRRK
ncbi:MAG: PEP-CTERM sorting domain-containing protein [Akkermansiaceae bacterium]